MPNYHFFPSKNIDTDTLSLIQNVLTLNFAFSCCCCWVPVWKIHFQLTLLLQLVFHEISLMQLHAYTYKYTLKRVYVCMYLVTHSIFHKNFAPFTSHFFLHFRVSTRFVYAQHHNQEESHIQKQS